MPKFVTTGLPDSTGLRPIWHGQMPSNGKGDYKKGGLAPKQEREMRQIRHEANKKRGLLPSQRVLRGPVMLCTTSLTPKAQKRLAGGFFGQP